MHYTLSAKVDPTQMGKSIEKESEDDRTELGFKSENDEPITLQISTQDENSSKAAEDVIRYNSSKPLIKSNVSSKKSSVKPSFFSNQTSKSYQHITKVLALLIRGSSNSDIDEPSNLKDAMACL